MQIELKNIKLEYLVKGYVNNQENGVIGYDGKLNIRPKYQREFIYNEKQRNAVIDTLRKGFPLNVMYWVENENGTFEVLDGQQRTISICEYVSGSFSMNSQYFHNLEKEEKDQILNYELTIYFCKGEDREKLDWFKTINIAGEKLTDQELRNAVYTGSWLTDAKKYFSSTGGPAFNVGQNYMTGTPIRQDYLETVLEWISDDNIENYMALNQHKETATELWTYFNKVISWVKIIFPKTNKDMKGIPWGVLYNQYKDVDFDLDLFVTEFDRLILDDDVTKKKGIYEYLITNNKKYLSLRAFSDSDKKKKYKEQKGICCKCDTPTNFDKMEADHITPWSEGGTTNYKNLQMLCKKCNREKSNK